jgi:hypothetical protein
MSEHTTTIPFVPLPTMEDLFGELVEEEVCDHDNCSHALPPDFQFLDWKKPPKSDPKCTTRC